MEPRGHCDTVGPHGIMETTVTLLGLMEPWRPLGHFGVSWNQGPTVTLRDPMVPKIDCDIAGPHGTMERPFRHFTASWNQGAIVALSGTVEPKRPLSH